MALRRYTSRNDVKIIMNKSYVYILANKTNRVLYVGVTSDLVKRVYEHRESLVEGFTKKYHITKLVYYEVFDNITYAIEREKQLKSGSREKKLLLIEKTNPLYEDLYLGLL